MLITEAQLGTTSMLGLDNMEFIAENTAIPATVPVVENNRIGGYLIDIEHLTKFAEDAAIDDLGVCLSMVCEANKIDPSQIRFSVSEASIITDAKLASLVEGMMANNVAVFAKPYDDPEIAALGEECLSEAINSDDFSYLKQFVGLDEANLADQVNDVTGVNANKKQMNRGAHRVAQVAMNNRFAKQELSLKEKIQDMIANSGTGKAILAKIRWLHKKVKEFNQKAAEDGAPIWKKLVSFVTKAIQVLTSKLHSAGGMGKLS